MLIRFVRYSFGNAMARTIIGGLPEPDELVGEMEGRASSSIRDDLFPGSEGTLPPIVLRLDRDYRRVGERIAAALPARSGSLLRTYLERRDFESLKLVFRTVLLHRQKKNPDLPVLPLPESNRFPLSNLMDAGSAEELLARMPRGPLRERLRRVVADAPGDLLFALETVLDRFFWEEILDRTRALSPFDRSAVLEILGLRADIDRFGIVCRGTRSGLADEAILAALPDMGTAYPREAVARALRSPDRNGELSKLYPGAEVENPMGRQGELGMFRRLRSALEKVMREHPFDISIPLAAVLLKETRIRDIQVILSGLLLGVDHDRIMALTGGQGGRDVSTPAHAAY